MKVYLRERCSVAQMLGVPALRTGREITTREGATEAKMPANWMIAPYLIAAIWWTYSPVDDMLFLAGIPWLGPTFALWSS